MLSGHRHIFFWRITLWARDVSQVNCGWSPLGKPSMCVANLMRNHLHLWRRKDTGLLPFSNEQIFVDGSGYSLMSDMRSWGFFRSSPHFFPLSYSPTLIPFLLSPLSPYSPVKNNAPLYFCEIESEGKNVWCWFKNVNSIWNWSGKKKLYVNWA